MTQTSTPPQFPAGAYQSRALDPNNDLPGLIAELREFPNQLRATVESLTELQLETKYRNWTIRQIVHHLADSHLNAFCRFKLTLTEDTPVIKPYDESRWSDMEDSRQPPVENSLAILTGLHQRWSVLADSIRENEWERRFFHPEHHHTVRLDEALAQYVWHSKHHLAQIQWVIQQQGW